MKNHYYGMKNRKTILHLESVQTRYDSDEIF